MCLAPLTQLCHLQNYNTCTQYSCATISQCPSDVCCLHIVAKPTTATTGWDSHLHSPPSNQSICRCKANVCFGFLPVRHTTAHTVRLPLLRCTILPSCYPTQPGSYCEPKMIAAGLVWDTHTRWRRNKLLNLFQYCCNVMHFDAKGSSASSPSAGAYAPTVVVLLFFV